MLSLPKHLGWLRQRTIPNVTDQDASASGRQMSMTAVFSFALTTHLFYHRKYQRQGLEALHQLVDKIGVGK